MKKRIIECDVWRLWVNMDIFYHIFCIKHKENVRGHILWVIEGLKLVFPIIWTIQAKIERKRRSENSLTPKTYIPKLIIITLLMKKFLRIFTLKQKNGEISKYDFLHSKRIICCSSWYTYDGNMTDEHHARDDALWFKFCFSLSVKSRQVSSYVC